jgi:hypothetical protein
MTEIEAAPWRGRAFGVVVESRTPVAGLLADTDGSAAPVVEWQAVTEDALGPERLSDSESLVDRRHPDGRPFMSIEQDPELGYRIAAPGFGAHLVAPDGSLIRSSLPPETGEAWQRLFFAQALPLAAALNGLALFHASAVVADGDAYAFVGLSGSGKTSVAAQLVARGAKILTDDVLALKPVEGEIHAYAGPARISIERSELDGLGADGRERLGRRLETPSEDGKVQLETRPDVEPVPLCGVFLLSRSSASRIAVKRDPENRTQALLAAAFLGYLMLPQRLALHLEVCSRIAAGVPTFSVQIGEATVASEAAETIGSLIERAEARR